MDASYISAIAKAPSFMTESIAIAIATSGASLEVSESVWVAQETALKKILKEESIKCIKPK